MKCINNMSLLCLTLAVKKRGCLAEMVKKTLTTSTHFPGINLLIVRTKSTFRFFGVEWAATTGCVGMITRLPFVNGLPHMPVALIVVHWSNRPVNWYFMKVWTASPAKLGIGI